MSKFGQYIAGLFVLTLVCCRPSAPPVERVLAIREMGALATTQYSISKIVKANDNQTWYKVGDRKILMSVDATVKAGIDLSQLKKEDIQINGKSIRISLPPPQILSLQIPPEKIKLEYEEVGLLRSGFDQSERTRLLEQAERQIEAAVPETGIIETTRKHTQNWVRQFCRQLGYEEIVIDFADQSSILP